MALALGARLGPYEIVEPLGRGGMGEVYRARDARLGRDVAVKVLPADLADAPGALARFEFEARSVAGLSHPNILALYDVGIEAGVSYAVTELLEGETLRDRLRREGALAPRKALDLAVQVARGLAAAHGRGIIHRDIKPENLFLTADGRLKILDFGLAARDARAPVPTDETRFVTEPGLLIGTVGYMAPEQIRGEPASARSDIFAFGLVLHETLAGSNPFRRDTISDTVAAILRDQPPPLPIAGGLPPLAARLIERCLEKRAEDRPESMLDLSFALEASTASAPATVGGPVPDGAGSGHWLSLWSLAGACALVILVTLALAAYVGLSADRVTRAAVAADLARADTLVLRAQQDRLERLQLHARLVASFPELSALFDLDSPTIRDFLQSYQQRSPGAPLLVALRPGGYVLAWTDADADVAPESGQEWLAALLAAGGSGIIPIGGTPHHAAVANAEAAGTIFGSVIAAAPVDDGFAQVLRDVTEAEAVVLGASGVAGASLRAGQIPWRSIEAFRAARGNAAAPLDVAIGPARYTAWEVPLVEDPPTSAVILASRDEASAGYRGIQGGMLLIGAAAAGVVLAAGLFALRRRAFPRP